LQKGVHAQLSKSRSGLAALKVDSLLQVMQELTEMSLKNFEGLRFPKEAVEHEVAAFIAVRGQGAHFDTSMQDTSAQRDAFQKFATHHDLHLSA